MTGNHPTPANRQRAHPDQLTLFDAGQRWRDGITSWRPATEGGFKPAQYRVHPITERAARGFVQRHHYSRSYPAATLRFGLIEARHLVGVAVLGVPMSRAVLTGPFPTLQPYRQSLELARLVLLDEVPCPAESWFVARVFAQAAAEGIRGVVAFSDPAPRRVAGELLMPGHIGTVYQALNGRYTGRGTSRPLTLLPDGRVFSARARAKVTGGERGAAHVRARLIELGAPPPAAGEPPARWLKRALAAAGTRTARHRGNHRYVWAIGDRGARRRTPIGYAALPFPTAIDEPITGEAVHAA